MKSVAARPVVAARAVIYARVSTGHQGEDGLGIEGQLKVCRAYAAEQDWTVVAEFREATSGMGLYDRKVLPRVRQLVQARGVDIVLTDKVDRLARMPADRAILRDEMRRYGVREEFATQNFEDTPQGEFLLAVEGFVARLEGVKVRDRTTRALRVRAEQGKTGGGRAPYGYRRIPIPGAAPKANGRIETMLVVDDIEAVVVRRIFRELAEGSSLRALAKQLSEEKVPTPWRAAFWKASVLSAMVANPIYVGRPVALRFTRHRDELRRSRAARRPEEETVPLPEGTVEAIVDEVTFAAVAERLRRNKLESRRGLSQEDAERFLLRSGFLRCGECGAVMGVLRRDGETREGIVSWGRSLYRCTRRLDPGVAPRSGGTCGVRVSAQTMDDAVWSWVEEMLENPERIAEDLERLDREDVTADDLDAVVRRLAEIARNRQRLVEGLIEVTDSAGRIAINDALTRLTSEEEGLEAARREIEQRRSNRERARAQMGDITVWCETVKERLGTMPYEAKRDALITLDISARVFRMGASERYVIESRLYPDELSLSHSRTSLGQTTPNGWFVLLRRRASDQSGVPPEISRPPTASPFVVSGDTVKEGSDHVIDRTD